MGFLLRHQLPLRCVAFRVVVEALLGEKAGSRISGDCYPGKRKAFDVSGSSRQHRCETNQLGASGLKLSFEATMKSCRAA